MAKASPKPESAVADAAQVDQVETTTQADEAGSIDAEETAAADAGEAPRTVRARVLAQCDLGGPNDVIEVAADVAEARADVLDTDASAIAYALSQVG
jgi:hypothetical protein